ncbi:hypothetical protein BH09BAC3_BH09BAC3_14050 [soil metagenome]
MKTRNYLFAGAFWMLAIACSPAPQTFDAAAAQKEIEAINQSFSEALSKSDSVGLSEFYTLDAKMMGPNGPALVGRDNIRAGFGGMIKGGIAKVTLKTLNVWGNSEYLTEEGELTLAIAGGQVVDQGKFLALWKKEDGKWKLFRDMYSSDLPVPAP